MTALYGIQGKVISIHAAQEGCDGVTGRNEETQSISIHAAQEGCDDLADAFAAMDKQFQSTQPKRAATSATLGTVLTQKRFQSTQPKRAATNT